MDNHATVGLPMKCMDQFIPSLDVGHTRFEVNVFSVAEFLGDCKS